MTVLRWSVAVILALVASAFTALTILGACVAYALWWPVCELTRRDAAEWKRDLVALGKWPPMPKPMPPPPPTVPDAVAEKLLALRSGYYTAGQLQREIAAVLKPETN